ncbi:arylphorin subunit alpha-like isoform X2 [Bicyclus anynana]|uniref:Arylphorin subunit alpha-like isoform X2 n=1 Tax=Bicyclus anynana TaxID=110368 RepID=A0ABM3LW99_BICAN|nr:arylphorin subunit alpha-like isoform X2 [Bicyclus anynana]
MKGVIVFLVSILCLQIKGYLIRVPTSATNTLVDTGGWVHIQKLLLPLFENVCEESTEPIIVRNNEEFKLNPSSGVYLNPDVVGNFQNLKAKGLLAKGEIFTEFNPDHMNELQVIYELLYYARDFDTFYKAACWARQNVNCGLFIDAIYLAILNRRDTEKVSLPPPYEILPNYFVRKGYIVKASSLIRGEPVLMTDCVRNEGNSYILSVNYTSDYDDTDDKLAYFHEDVGLNSYFFLTKLKTLPWLNDSQRKTYGLYLYHIMKQMMARYNLERYSNGLPEVDRIDWDDIDKSSFDPLLIYSNGNQFSQRMSGRTGDSELLTTLKNIEDNLQGVVLHMRDGGYSKSDIMTHLMEILVTSERSYLNIAQQFINEEGLVSRYPSVLEHYMTSVRDPMFWKLKKTIIDLVDNALQVLPSYSRNELYFPGVEIQNVEVKKMMTTFDNFKFDVTSALKSEGEDTKFEVKIEQPRLNHKPFSFKISVLSHVAQKALVKIYIGPKVMPGELTENKNLFMLLDRYEVNLKIGSNILSRASNEMTSLSEDLPSLESLHKYVLDAEFGIDALPHKSIWSQIGFPSRLVLPKGTSEGLPLHVFVFIAPYTKATIGGSKTNVDLNTDAIFTPGYPLDLNIEIQQLFNLPNAMVKDIMITHKTESTSYTKPTNNYNSASNGRVWPTDDQETDVPNGPLYLSTRPEFTKKSFDYKSKSNQYGKKTDYEAKRGYYNKPSIKPEENTVQLEKDVTNIVTNNEAWPTNNNDFNSGTSSYLSSRPEFTKRTFDYKSKTNQYGKKYDYAAKRVNYDNQNKTPEDVKNHQEDEKTFKEPEKTEIVNKVYIDTDKEYDTNRNFNKDTTFHKIILDKDNEIYTKVEDEKYFKDFDKFVDVKTHKIHDKTVPDTMDVVNNIYISRDHDEVPEVNDDETIHNVFILDKHQIDDLLDINSNEIDNDDFEKVIEVKNFNVKPHGLLTMPKRKMSNIFNIIFKPLKAFDFDEKVYE